MAIGNGNSYKSVFFKHCRTGTATMKFKQTEEGKRGLSIESEASTKKILTAYAYQIKFSNNKHNVVAFHIRYEKKRNSVNYK